MTGYAERSSNNSFSVDTRKDQGNNNDNELLTN